MVRARARAVADRWLRAAAIMHAVWFDSGPKSSTEASSSMNAAVMDRPDPYAPFLPADHDDTCAGLCTGFSAFRDSAVCDTNHGCWCPDGGLSYAEFSQRHPNILKLGHG